MYSRTLLSLSLGGSWGSEAEGLEEGGGAENALGFSLGSEVSSLTWGGCFSTVTSFSAFGGSEGALLGVFSDGATWLVAPSPDFEMTAIFTPGSTVSPSLATNCKNSYQSLNAELYWFSLPLID